MRLFRYVPALLLVGAVAAAPAGAARRAGSAVSSQTAANLITAAHGEAFAHAKYWVYAAEARQSGNPSVAQLFLRTSRVELYDHFMALARMAGLIHGNPENLQDSINGESSEASSIYPGFAAQALADHDPSAAAFWEELAADEATHAAMFEQALTAITNPFSGVTVPAGPTVSPYPVAAGPAQSSGATLENLLTTMRGESFANAKYLTYARTAQRSKQPRLARLWERTGAVELEEHFAEAAVRYGQVGDTAANLHDAIAGEVAEATHIYPDYADQAKAAGDNDAAELFMELARDEAKHAASFLKALHHLEH